MNDPTKMQGWAILSVSVSLTDTLASDTKYQYVLNILKLFLRNLLSFGNLPPSRHSLRHINQCGHYFHTK